jgi:hypothetical protein
VGVSIETLEVTVREIRWAQFPKDGGNVDVVMNRDAASDDLLVHFIDRDGLGVAWTRLAWMPLYVSGCDELAIVRALYEEVRRGIESVQAQRQWADDGQNDGLNE